jgi:predicted peroxiredoxin
MVTRLTPALDLREASITTYIVFALREALAEGAPVELVVDDDPAISNDLLAWSRVTGHEIAELEDPEPGRRYRVQRGNPAAPGRHFAAIISTDDLLELLSPLGFALGAALEGLDVSLYFQGPGVHTLRRGFVPRMHGWGGMFSRFARKGLDDAGHVHPQEKLRQIVELGGRIYACGPSMKRFKVPVSKLAFDVTVAEYLTFTEVMARADIHLYG